MLAGLIAVAVLMSAGLLWLHQSSVLATTGERIYSLDVERQALLERRSSGLVAYAAATDPLRLEARARALGFAPTRDVEVLVVPLRPDSVVAGGFSADSPLGITGMAAVRADVPPPSLTERILAIGLNQASADSREVPYAVGSAP
jgi:hypothetical protein